MAELSPSIYSELLKDRVQLDVQGSIREGQRSALGQMLLQEQRREQQQKRQVEARLRQAYAQGGTAGAQTGMLPLPGAAGAPGAVQETVHTPYSSDLQAMLSQYQQEGADVTPTPGARTLPGGPPAMGAAPGQAPMAPQRGGNVLTPDVIRDIGMIDPQAAMAAQKYAQDSHTAQLEMHGKQAGMVAQVARGILLADTQAAYEQGVTYLRSMGIPVDHLPAMYDRRLVENYYHMGTDAETRVKEAQSRLIGTQAELEPRKLAFEERREQRIGEHQGIQEERLEKQRVFDEEHKRNMENIQRDAAERGWTAEQRQAAQDKETQRHNLAIEGIQRGTAERAQTQAKTAQENVLRDEFEKETKPYKVRSEFYGTLQTGVQDPTGAGDIAIIYSYMKMLDPGSTVLSGEYATAANTGSIPERVWNMYNKALSGELLGADEKSQVRQNFVNQAQKIYEQSTKDYERTKKTFEERSHRYKVDPANVTRDVGTTYTPPTAGGVGAPAAPGSSRQRVSRATVDKLAAEEKVPRATVVQRLRAAGLDVED